MCYHNINLVFLKNFPSIIDILFLNGTSAFRIVKLFYKFPIGFVRIYAHNSLTYSPRSYSRVKFHFIFISSLDESTDYIFARMAIILSFVSLFSFRGDEHFPQRSFLLSTGTNGSSRTIPTVCPITLKCTECTLCRDECY